MSISSERIFIHVKNMLGELLTIDCSPSDSISQIYSVVQESLEEPHPPLSALCLYQYDEKEDDYVPLHSLTDDLHVSLFIDNMPIDVAFHYEDSASICYMYRSRDPIFMEDESVDIIRLEIIVEDKMIMEFSFITHLYHKSALEPHRYTDICYHMSDVCLEMDRAEPRNGGSDKWHVTIYDDAVRGATPADLIHHHIDYVLKSVEELTVPTDRIYKKVKEEWLKYTQLHGCSEIYPMASRFEP
jgi:hypothetical protein